MYINNLFPNLGNYLVGGSTVVFTIAGFTNPPDTAKHYLTLSTVDSSNYLIDQSTTLFYVKTVSATMGSGNVYVT